MNKFVTIPPVKNDREVRGLRKLYDEVETTQLAKLRYNGVMITSAIT